MIWWELVETDYVGPCGTNLNSGCRRSNLTQQNQSLPMSERWGNIAMGQTRPPAGLGDNQVRLGQFKFYVQLCTVCFVRLKMYVL